MKQQMSEKRVHNAPEEDSLNLRELKGEQSFQSFNQTATFDPDTPTRQRDSPSNADDSRVHLSRDSD